MTKEDYVIICGDFGGVWSKDKESNEETMLMDWLDCKSYTTLFVDGNHENFDRLKKYPARSTNGEGENQAYPSYEEKACWSRYGRVTRNGNPLPAPESRPGSCREIQVLHCVYKSFPAIQCIAAGEALFWTLNTPEKRHHSVYRNPEAPIQYTVYTRFYPYSVYRGLRSSVSDTKHPPKSVAAQCTTAKEHLAPRCVYKIFTGLLPGFKYPGLICLADFKDPAVQLCCVLPHLFSGHRRHFAELLLLTDRIRKRQLHRPLIFSDIPAKLHALTEQTDHLPVDAVDSLSCLFKIHAASLLSVRPQWKPVFSLCAGILTHDWTLDARHRKLILDY